MKAGYGQLFLLFLAIGFIFLATSGKGLAIYQILTGKASTTPAGKPPEFNPTNPAEWVKDKDKAGSGSGGVMG